jgi:hypothetical protein
MPRCYRTAAAHLRCPTGCGVRTMRGAPGEGRFTPAETFHGLERTFAGRQRAGTALLGNTLPSTLPHWCVGRRGRRWLRAGRQAPAGGCCWDGCGNTGALLSHFEKLLRLRRGAAQDLPLCLPARTARTDMWLPVPGSAWLCRHSFCHPRHYLLVRISLNIFANVGWREHDHSASSAVIIFNV